MRKLLGLILVTSLVLSLVLPGIAFADTQYTTRVSGTDRIATAIEISRTIYPVGLPWGNPDFVIICRSDNYPDALAAASMAWYGGNIAPILITGSSSLDSRVRDEIIRLAPTGVNMQGFVREAVIIGGTGAISTAVETELTTLLGANAVLRVGGADRYETAVLVDDIMDGTFDGAYVHNGGTVVIATGENFADALSASAWTSQNYVPTLLVKQDSIPQRVLEALTTGKPNTVIVVGGPGAVSANVFNQLNSIMTGVPGAIITRVGGADRYATSVAIAENANMWGNSRTFGYGGWDGWTIARGDDFPDALCGGILAGGWWGMPLFLTQPTAIPGSLSSYMTAVYPIDNSKGLTGSIDNFILGGTGAIATSVGQAWASLVSAGDWAAVPAPTIASVAGDTTSPAGPLNTLAPALVITHRAAQATDRIAIFDGATQVDFEPTVAGTTQTTIALGGWVGVLAQGNRNLTVVLWEDANGNNLLDPTENRSVASNTFVYNYDATGPTVASVVVTDNGTTPNWFATGDRMVITFTEAMNTASIGVANAVVDNGLGTQLLIQGVGAVDCTIGTVAGSYTASWSADGRVLTLTFTATTTGAITTITDFDVLGTVLDVAGNAAVDTAVLPTGSF